MSTKKLFSTALMLAMLGACAAHAADPPPQPMPYVGPTASGTNEMPPATPGGSAHQGLSQYITYTTPDCCGNLGEDGPVRMEIYTRDGISSAVQGGQLHDQLETGLMFQFGGRTLLFDAPDIRAWTFDLSISHVWNHGSHEPTLSANNGDLVSLRNLNRTDVNFALGREYYLMGDGESCGRKWRAGFDGGIRWGTTSLQVSDPAMVSNFQRQNSWNYGPFVAVHTDLEYRAGCCTWILGLRLEWDESFNNHLLVGGDNNLMDLNLLLNLGVRY